MAAVPRRFQALKRAAFPRRQLGIASRRLAPAEDAEMPKEANGGSSSSGSSCMQSESSLFDSMEKAQEMLALVQRNVSEELYQEVERRRHVFKIPRAPLRSLSSDGAGIMNPLKLLQRIKRQPNEPPVTADRAEGLVLAMEQELKALTSPVIDVQLPDRQAGADPRLVVVGDVHGQLQDVLHIFEEQGTPSEELAYIFNGDIVDRGRNACEIWFLIIAFKLAHPRSVYVLRGNHENEQMISRPFKMGGGFSEECLSKYSQGVLAAFQRMFKLLPIFAVLEEEIFIVHGGLFRNPAVNLEMLRSLPKATWQRNYPNPLTKEATARGEKWSEEEEILFDAQWADPHYGSGSRPSSRGRVAVTFGEDVTHRFLDSAGLKLCLRSHRVPQTGSGYELEHGGRLLTLFSASRYGGVLSNRGAVAVMRSADEAAQDFSELLGPTSSSSTKVIHSTPLQKLQMSLVEHDVSTLNAATDQQAVTKSCIAQVRRELESAAREHDYDMEQHALGLICSERHALWSKLRQLDVRSTGCVSRAVLCEVLSEVCSELGWSSILERTSPELGSHVAYSEFLAAPNVRWFHLGAAQIVKVARATAKAELRLSGLAALFDSPNGTVTPQLAREALGQLLPSLRAQQRRQLASCLFGEETTQLSAVLHQLALFADPPQLSEPWMQSALRRIVSLVLKQHGPPPLHSALIRFFRETVTQGSDLIGPKEFVTGVQNLGAYDCSGDDEVPLLHAGRLYKLFEAIDSNGSGTVSFLELLLAMDERTARPELPEFPALEGAVPAILLVHKASVLKMCRALDPMDVGRISVANFVELVTSLFSVLGRPLASAERAAIEQELSGEDLAYSELLGSFEVSASGGAWQWSNRTS